MIYHSDFEKWSFGKLSAMREAALTLEGGYDYYYMGFYIHSCAKMRYKGQYSPSYILDPETYGWNPLDGELRQLLDTKAFVSLSRERRLKEAHAGSHSKSEHNSSSDADPPVDKFDDYPYPTAREGADAVEKGMSLFDLKVPGLMTVEEMEQKVELNHQAIKVRGVSNDIEAEVSELTSCHS